MKVRTSDLTDLALRWAVTKIENPQWWVDGYMNSPVTEHSFMKDDGEMYCPEIDWSQGGPIIDREIVSIQRTSDERFEAVHADGHCEYGATMLIAAMRCYVASKLGDEVDVPEELLT